MSQPAFSYHFWFNTKHYILHLRLYTYIDSLYVTWTLDRSGILMPIHRTLRPRNLPSSEDTTTYEYKPFFWSWPTMDFSRSPGYRIKDSLYFDCIYVFFLFYEGRMDWMYFTFKKKITLFLKFPWKFQRVI